MENQRFQILREKFRFADFREGQEEIIEALLSKRDVVAVMPTGSGKSLCYQLPALLMEGVTLVVSPLIALMKDQVDNLTQNQIPATFINSTLTLSEQQERLWQIRAGQFKLVYIAPERFRSAAFMEGIQPCRVTLLAVDEAHCVSEWGHDFRPDYLRLRSAIDKLNHPPVAALTATATPEVRRDIIEQLGLRQPLTLVTGFDRPNLHFRVREVESEREKLEVVLALLNREPHCGIVYAATRKNVEAVTKGLQAHGHKVGSYHAGMEMESRKTVQEQFMRGALPLVVATNAFGMGIDKADLRFIVHYDIPGSLEAYYQEVGRAGRDNKPATCLLLFNYADSFTQEFFIEGNCPPRQLVEETYQALCDIGTDEIEITLKALARRLGQTRSNEMALGSCLNILEKAGYIERGSEGEHQAKVTLRAEPDWLRGQVDKAKFQKEIVTYLLDVSGGIKDKTLNLDLHAVAGDLNLSPEQLRRTFSALHHCGYVEYRAPFRGRGLKILRRVPLSGLKVNFAEVERRAEFERQKLRKMVDYAYSRQCLRRFILEYFGEQVSQRQCHNCSSCLEVTESLPPRTLTEEEILIVRKVLSCVARMKGQYGKMRVSQVLTGSKAKALEYLRLNRLSTYGILKELTQPEVLSLLDGLVEARLLEIEGTEYPLVKLTAEGREAMLGKVPVAMVFPLTLVEDEEPEREGGLVVARSVDTPDRAYHQELFEALRDTRRKLAQEANLPPYIIFHDETLKSISRRLPRTASELLTVKGCGGRKVAAYGEQTLVVVETFLKAHPEALPILEDVPSTEKSVTRSPSIATVEITWKLWQDGKPLSQIATERALAKSTIVDHLARLLEQGRTVDLSRILPRERINLIEAAVDRAGTERLAPIKASLPEDVSYDEIRLVLGQYNQKKRSQQVGP
jgi:ATP-dependent DNA helicase RecQ